MKHDLLIVPPGKKVRLKDFDPAHTGKFHDKDEAREKLATDIVRLAEYQTVLYAQDTVQQRRSSGQSRNLFRRLDPLHGSNSNDG